MKKQFYNLMLFAFLFSSCGTEPMIKQVDQFDIAKYKGYKVIYKCNYDNWKDRDWYVLRNDTIAIELRVPKWFSQIYRVGDTIK